MEAPLHKSPVPAPRQQQDAVAAALLQQAAAAVSTVTMAQQNAPTMAMGREQCPRCASRDTKFCYFNNYNTAQPRHFCRACRRYWTLGGSLRNVPVGGSTRRKRPRPARPTRALAAAVASAAAATAISASSSCGPFASPAAAPVVSAESGGLLSSLLLGSAPLLEGRLGFDPSLGQPAALAHQLGIAAGPLLWPTSTISQEPAWKSGGGVFPPAAATPWQEELAAAAAPMDHAGGLLLLHQHHGTPPLLL
ncbi:hypothetical protein EJB05_00688, partial [Eragrostis curvula]